MNRKILIMLFVFFSIFPLSSYSDSGHTTITIYQQPRMLTIHQIPETFGISYRICIGMASGVYTRFINTAGYASPFSPEDNNGNPMLASDQFHDANSDGHDRRLHKDFPLNNVLNHGAQYFISVAVRNTDTSEVVGYSNEVSYTIPLDTSLPSDVTNFSADLYGTGIRLTWNNAPELNFDHTVLHFSTQSDQGPWTLLEDEIKGLSNNFNAYDHPDLPSGNYFYKIHSCNTAGLCTQTRYAYKIIEPPKQDFTEEDPVPEDPGSGSFSLLFLLIMFLPTSIRLAIRQTSK